MTHALLAPTKSRRPTRRRRMMAEAGGSDLWLLTAVVALTLLGLVVVYSATYALSYMNTETVTQQPDVAAVVTSPAAPDVPIPESRATARGTTTWYLYRQGTWVALGLGLMVFCWALDYRVWQKLSLPLMGLTILALLALFVVGKTSFGATRWLVAGGSVQPAEAAKLVTILYVAHWASSKGERIRSVEVGLIPFGILIGTVCGLILMQPSFSTALLVGAVATTMFFIAGADLKQLLITGLAAGGMLFIIVQKASYRVARLQTWKDPWDTEMGGGYQTVQVLYALARGGIFGQGLGTTEDKMLYVPAAHTDAIMAILGQEMGLVAGLVVLALFLVIAFRGFRIASTAPDAFGTVLASGLTCWITYQALFNISVITNTIPNTGIPMPFISFGGSGLVSILAGVGMLLSISRMSGKLQAEGQA